MTAVGRCLQWALRLIKVNDGRQDEEHGFLFSVHKTKIMYFCCLCEHNPDQDL